MKKIDVFAKNIDCSLWYSDAVEDQKDHTENWGPANNSTESKSDVQNSFIYQSAKLMKGETYWGLLEFYPAGGYVANLGNNKQSALPLIKGLDKANWVDQFTRAVFVEFNVFNANTELFSLVTLVFEFPPSGGVFATPGIETVVLYRYNGAAGLVALLTEIACILCLIVIAIRMIVAITKQKWTFFRQFWNWVQMMVIVLTLTAFGVYIYRSVWTSSTVEDMMNNRGKISVCKLNMLNLHLYT